MKARAVIKRYTTCIYSKNNIYTIVLFIILVSSYNHPRRIGNPENMINALLHAYSDDGVP